MLFSAFSRRGFVFRAARLSTIETNGLGGNWVACAGEGVAGSGAIASKFVWKFYVILVFFYYFLVLFTYRKTLLIMLQ